MTSPRLAKAFAANFFAATLFVATSFVTPFFAVTPVASAAGLRAQIGTGPGSQAIQQSSGTGNLPDVLPHDPASPDPAIEAMHARMEKAQRSQNFTRMQTDADRLLKLAAELKADVDKSTKDEMSLDTIRKAEEVEKLARDIRTRMRGQ